MKRLILLIAPVFLSACALQNPEQGEPEFTPSAYEQCYTNCEYTHSGEIRACVRRPVTMGRGIQFERCIGDSYETLGICYQACAEQ